jgi:hypothetical protein
MGNLFKDRFTGRIVESIGQTTDEHGTPCFEFSFLGTHQKLRIETDTYKASIWIDDDKLSTHF